MARAQKARLMSSKESVQIVASGGIRPPTARSGCSAGGTVDPRWGVGASGAHWRGMLWFGVIVVCGYSV